MKFSEVIDPIFQDKEKRFLAITALMVTLVIMFVFRGSISFLIERWNSQEELGHSYFIPLISGWLVWSNRDAVIKSIGAPSLFGVVLALIAAGLLILGPLANSAVLPDIGLVLAITALVVGFGGVSLLKITAIPLIYLLFAIPPPVWIINSLSWNMQSISSGIGVALIRMMNIPVNLSGNIIDLGLMKLQVAEACSGLRYLFPLMSLGFLVAYLFKAPLWQRAIVFFSSIPITILMNSLRIAITGALVQAYGLSHTEGFLHFFEGWVIFLLCLIALVAIVAFFCLAFPPRRHVLDVLEAPKLTPITPSKAWKPSINAPTIFAGTASLLIVSSLIATFTIDEKLIVPERAKFAKLPAEFVEWDHIIRPLDTEIATTLSADDSLVVDFETPEDEKFNLYLAYLTQRRDGATWHSPQMCVPGGGWEIISNEIIPANTGPDSLPYPYWRMIIQRGRSRQLLYYWYDQRGRKIANELKMKATVVYDTITRRRADGSLVRVMTPVERSEDIETADARLKGMVRQLNTHLPKYIPQ